MPPEQLAEEGRRCPQCGAVAEPEQDGDVLFYACACGAEFGYQRVQQGRVCAAGLAAADPEAPAPGASVFIGTTIRRRPE